MICPAKYFSNVLAIFLTTSSVLTQVSVQTVKSLNDVVKAYCCIQVTGNEGLSSVIAAAGIHTESISKIF